MPRKKKSSRLDTYNKLRDIKKSNSRDIIKLQLEDVEQIIDNEDFRNIILLRKFIKNGNTLDYFDENIKLERKDLNNEQ